MNYMSLAAEQEGYVISLRRHLHRHPELTGREENTVALICEELEKSHISHVCVPNGGVIGFIGDNKNGRSVLLRADIDGLPIQESPQNGGGMPKAVVSSVDRISHACGHDCHTAILLGAARALKGIEHQLNGRVILMFERGEEGGGNLGYLIKWIFDHQLRIDSCFALHVVANVPSGKIVISQGYQLAGSLVFTVRLHGKSAHGAQPFIGRSTIDCFCTIYGMLQEFRMKYASPYAPMVFSVGQVHAGHSYNSIPDHLEFQGSFRIFDFEDGLRIKEHLTSVVETIPKLYGCTAELIIGGPSPSVVNDRSCAEMARQVFSGFTDQTILYDLPPQMNSDSFSLTSSTWPGVYMLLGTQNKAKGMVALNHTPCFDPDESTFRLGTACHIAYAAEFLDHGPDTSSRIFSGTMEELFLKYRPEVLDTLREN